jgi:catechol 2,3-dioxygenase-like lactoylglutathione lyase family enzyme
MSIRPHSIHHVNVPIGDMERTKEWYGKVFGMRHIPRTVRQGGAPGVDEVLLLTRGNFDLHFTLHENPPDIKPHHFCIEVEDWDAFLAHLESLGIEYTEPLVRPQNQSRATYIYDPDENLIEIMWHENWNHESPIQPD